MSAAPSVNEPSSASNRSPSRGISRTMVNFLLDSVLLLVFLSLVWIGFVVRFVFPKGTAADGWTLWSYGYDEWSEMQFWVLCLLMLGILVHVMLHWSWICGVVTSRMPRRDGKPVRWDDGTRTIFGVGLIIVIVNVLGVLMAIASFMVRSP